MSKTIILDTLRAYLKARELNYKDLGHALGLSEVSVKRLFAGGDLGLDRLEQICHFLQIEMADLFKTSPLQRALLKQLSQAQEAELAASPPLLTVAVCALSFWTWQDMRRHLNLTPARITELLYRLQAIGFLEMQSRHQYRLLVSSNFAWITGGPIMKLVQANSHDYFDNPFADDAHVLRILNVRISKAAQVRLKRRLEQIAQEYVDQSRADSHLPLTERPPLSICIAARSWIPKFMQTHLRQAGD